MGLDMFLRKRPKFSNDENVSDAICSFVTWIRSKMKFGDECSYKDWCGRDYNDLPDTKSLVEALEKFPLDSFDEEEVGYWRKANAIHKWFVENVQDGIDDCGMHRSVTKDDLLRLKNLCEKVLENHDLADKLLPSSAGFFFGNLEYDDIYFDKLQYTKELCAKLTEEDGFDFENYYLYYVTSW